MTRHSAGCSVCIVNDVPIPRQYETFLHLFFKCHHCSKYQISCRNWIVPWILWETEQIKQSFGYFAFSRQTEGILATVLCKVVFSQSIFSSGKQNWVNGVPVSILKSVAMRWSSALPANGALTRQRSRRWWCWRPTTSLSYTCVTTLPTWLDSRRGGGEGPTNPPVHQWRIQCRGGFSYGRKRQIVYVFQKYIQNTFKIHTVH